MKRTIPLLAVLMLVGCGGSQQQAGPAKAPPKDPKMQAIEERIAKTTPEGKQVIDKAQAMKPEVNGVLSGKTLGEMVNTYAKENGAYNIIPIGWEAAQKKSTGNWKIAFNYQDWQKQYLVAEWEYNPKTNNLYPFEQENAKGFWIKPEGKEKPRAATK